MQTRPFRLAILAVVFLTLVPPLDWAAPEPPHLKRLEEEVFGMLEDTSRWHLLPEEFREFQTGAGSIPMAEMSYGGSYLAPRMEQTAEWPFTLSFQDPVVSDGKGRLLSRTRGYFDGGNWHSLPSGNRSSGPKHTVWLTKGPAYAGEDAVYYFHGGKWNVQVLSREGDRDNKHPKLQQGRNGTATAWMAPSSTSQGVPPHLSLFDGNSWRVLTPENGLPNAPMVWAACVSPGKIWCLDAGCGFRFVTVSQASLPPGEQVDSMVEAYLTSPAEARGSLIETLVEQQPEALRAVQRAISRRGTGDGNARRIEVLVGAIQSDLEQLASMARAMRYRSPKVQELERSLRKRTGDLREAWSEGERSAQTWREYKALLALLREVATGGPGGKSYCSRWVCHGFDPKGYLWFEIATYRQGDRESSLLRLGPDGSREIVLSGPEREDFAVALTPREGPYIFMPDGSGLARYGEEGLELVMPPSQWPQDMRPVTCAGNGWIVARRHGEEYWLVRPDAEDHRQPLTVMEYASRQVWTTDNGRVICLFKSDEGGLPAGLYEFLDGAWICVFPGDIEPPKRIASGQDGSLWLYGMVHNDYGPLRVIHKGELVLKGDLEELCVERFRDVMALAPVRAAYTQGPIRLGDHIWYVEDSLYPVRTEGKTSISLRTSLAHSLQGDRNLLLSGPMDDGSSFLTLVSGSNDRCGRISIDDNGEPVVSELEVLRARVYPNQWLDRPIFDGRGRVLVPQEKFRYRAARPEDDRAVPGEPLYLDPFGRVWSKVYRQGLMVSDQESTSRAFPTPSTLWQPVVVSSRDLAYLTNRASIVELRCDEAGEWTVARRFDGIRWPQIPSEFLAEIDGYALFRARSAVLVVKLPDYEIESTIEDPTGNP